ncbi:hypothetical protein [Neptunicella marina]|uniref:PEP-CTERM sorting domain-containing protein n=1 Tax=Neptunicella marina TaxID=2125989 RepID=A0A8J6ITD6_9ALTE|nr:hypothetical protein [Neptunicella marina]MBC3765417.1 hypothetical protein [Neptunicella marina]
MKMKFLIGAAILLASSQSMAGAIINGDIANSCSLNGWETDTDGLGPGGSNDFTIVGSAPDCSIAINVDYWGANFTDVFFANTLYQNLALSAAADSTFLLSFDFSVDSELTSADAGFIADYFAIGFGDGTGSLFDQYRKPGYLVAPTDIDGINQYSFSFELDNSWVNQAGWALEFQVLPGFDNNTLMGDFAGSSLYLQNVSLNEVPNATVDEAPVLAFFALGLGLMAWRRNNSQQISRNEP